jgi:hypothetical protein
VGFITFSDPSLPPNGGCLVGTAAAVVVELFSDIVAYVVARVIGILDGGSPGAVEPGQLTRVGFGAVGD